MNFTSPIFLFLFLPVFILIYFLTKGRAKLVVGIIGSLNFYAWGYLSYLPLMLGLMLFAYGVARGITRWRDQRLSRVLFWGGVLVTVVVLVQFKLWTDIKYPLGLSYVTFQVIAYLWEVYNRKIQAERDLLLFSFYLLLFPKILVGPITRYSQLHDQIKDIRVKLPGVATGFRRFIVGLAKKALIADTLAKVVTPVFSLSSPDISPAFAWLVILSYSLQIYFDFSGYTDMAIGIGQMMGLRFVENFNYPYISRNIGEFWRRWHISLSTWFRDLVFYPLERRRLKWGQPVNILIVFVLTGLWHGITANFVIWGLIHGSALIFEGTYWGRKLRTFWTPIQYIYALGVILVGWVFFRSPTIKFAWIFIRRLLGDTRGLQTLPFESTNPLPFIEPTFVLALIAGLLFSVPIRQWLSRWLPRVRSEKAGVRIAFQAFGDLALLFLFLFSIAAMVSSAFTPGIYDAF